MNDLNPIQCSNEIKQMFENFADKRTPFIIVCSVIFEYEKIKFFNTCINVF